MTAADTTQHRARDEQGPAPVLVVGDGALVREVGAALEGGVVASVEDYLMALGRLAHQPAAVLVGTLDGLDESLVEVTARALRRIVPKIRLLLVVTPEEEPAARQAVERGFNDYLIAPLRRAEVRAVVHAHARRAAAEMPQFETKRTPPPSRVAGAAASPVTPTPASRAPIAAAPPSHDATSFLADEARAGLRSPPAAAPAETEAQGSAAHGATVSAPPSIPAIPWPAAPPAAPAPNADAPRHAAAAAPQFQPSQAAPSQSAPSRSAPSQEAPPQPAAQRFELQHDAPRAATSHAVPSQAAPPHPAASTQHEPPARPAHEPPARPAMDGDPLAQLAAEADAPPIGAGEDFQLGDIDLVDQVLRDRRGLPALAMRVVAERSGIAGVAWCASEEQVPAGHVAEPVVYRDRAFGVLHSPSRGAEGLASWAAWLAHWMALESRMTELWEASYRDELTGVWNRRYFNRFLDAILPRAANQRFRVTLMVFDIDDFKIYNDRYGHAAGDQILREAARLMQSVVRKQDVVARIGGDEFAVIFWDAEEPRRPNSQHPDSVRGAATRFQRAICDHRFPKLLEDAPGTLTISGGLAGFPWDGQTAEALLELADARALQSKRQGKNCITFGPGAEQECQIGPRE